MDQIKDECLEYWQLLVKTENAFYRARVELFANCSREHIVDLVSRALDGYDECFTALGIAYILTLEEKKKLFNKLLLIASHENKYLVKAREVILSLPKDWLLSNIEKHAEPILQNAAYDEYRRFLELYINIDHELTIRLAHRASLHSDEDISEAGKDFLGNCGI